MKDFATENQARDDLSAKPSTVELQAGDGPVTAYVLLSREPEEFNSAAQSVSFGSMELASAKVYADEAEAIGFAEVTGAKLEKVEIPGGLARDVFLKKWMKAAKKNKQGLLPFLLLPLAACGGGGGAAPVTFTVTEAANLISFGGTATGDITSSSATVGAVTTTTFTRGGLTDTAVGVFATGAPKQIIAAAGQTVIVTGDQIAGPNELKASGAGNVTINATDAGAGTVTAVSTKIDVVLTGGTLTFDMSNDNEDSITLTAGSVINLGGGTLVVSDGKVNASGVAISNVSGVTLNSTLVVDLADFKEIQDAGGFTGTGTLEVNPSTSDAVGTTTNLGTGGVGVAAGAINNAEFTEAEYLALFTSGVTGGNTSGAVATGNLATLAANSVTIVGSVSNTDVLASLQTNVAKIAAGGVTAMTLANDAAITTFSALVANAGVAADSVTVTNGAITGAKAAIVASAAKFKADQIDSITLTDAEAAVTGFLADDAFNANSVTIGAVTTSEAAVLANGREIANNGITAITITAAEFGTFTTANGDAPFLDESVTLGDVTTNQGDVVDHIAKVVDGGIASITLTATQFQTIVTAGVNALDALQTHSVTISDPASLTLAGAITQANVQMGLALNVKGSVTLDVSAVTGVTASHAELMSLYAANAAGTVSGLGNEALVANDTNITVSEANNLASKTTGALTATISNGDMATLNGLEGTGNVYSITVADTSAAASDLIALDAKTAGVVNANAVTTLNGTHADINSVLALEAAATTTIPANVAAVVTDTISATQAEALTVNARIGTGVVTATVTADQADDLRAALSNTAADVLSLTVLEDTGATDAADLLLLDGLTAGTIDVSNVTAVQGLVAELTAAAGIYGKADIIGLGNSQAITENSGGGISIANANALAALTTGVVTATVTAGSANALATGLNETGNAYTLAVSDAANGGTVAAGDLLTLNGQTTTAIDVTLVDDTGGSTLSLTGTYSEIKALFAAAAAGDYTGLQADLPISVTGGISVSQANEINALTTKAVTATISTGDMATLNGLEGTGNVYAITVADVSGDMGELNALNAKTTGVLTVGAVNTLTGTNAELTTMLGGQATLATAVNFTGFNAAEAIILSDASVTAAQADTASQATTGLLTATVAAGALGATNTAFADSGGQVNNISFTVTDSTAAAATLNLLDAKTTVDIDVSAANAISGANADIVALYNNAANFVGLGNENITATDASITVAEALVLLGNTSGSLTGTITAAGASQANLASLAAFDSQIAGTITNLTLTIDAATAASVRSGAQFDGLTDTQSQALFNHVAGGVTITGNAGADWIDLRGFNTTGVDFTINAAAGDNRIYSGDGNDTINTTTGADFINVGGGRDTVNAGAGIDEIEVDSLNNVDGSVYDGEGGNDRLTMKGIHDLTNTNQTSIETLRLQPGSPSEVTLTATQAEAYGTISGTAGNSKLIIEAELAKVTYAGAAAKLDGGGTDTITFTYQAAAKTVTGNFSTLAELQTAVDAQVGGAGNVFASLTNGNADVTLTVKAIGETITAPGYANNGGGNVAGAAAAQDTAVDMTGVAFQNLAELKADAGVGISLSATNVANIGAVESDAGAVALNLAAETISSDLDISSMSFNTANPNIGLTINSGVTVTATAAQVAATNFAATGGGTLLIKGASGSVQTSTLDLPGNGTVDATNVIVDVGADMSVTTNVLTNVTGFNIQAGKTLTINSASVTGLDVTGDGTMVMNLGTANFSLTDVAASVSATATVATSTAMHTSANLGTLVTTVNNGQTLSLLASQATGKTINGAGHVTLNSLDASAAADLSKITVAGTKLAKVALDVTFTGDLAGFDVDVANTKTLTATAAKLTGVDISDATGSGKITVTDLGAAAFNASNFDIGGALLVKTVSNGDTTITLNGSTNILSATAGSKTIDITDGGDTLVATAAQLDALAVTDTATGNVTVTALGAADFDISNFSIAGNLLAQTETGGGANTITLGTGSDFTAGTVAGTRTVDITDNGDTLIATAANLHEVLVTDGSNTSNLTVTALGNAEFDGTGINIGGNLLMTTVDDGTDNQTFTLNAGTVLVGNTVTGTRTLNILDSDKVIGTAAQLTGLTVGDVANTGSVEVTALGAAAFDASNYDLGGSLVLKTATGAGNFALHSTTKIVEATIAGTTTIDVTDNNSTLTATAAQVTGLAVTDAALANLTVTALDGTKMDLNAVDITGDLLVQTATNSSGDVITLHADTNILGAGIGGAKTRTISITEGGDTLAATAAQLTGATVTDVGTSNVIVNGLGGTKFEAQNFSIAGALTVNTVNTGATTITLDGATNIIGSTTGGTETINITRTGDTLVATAAQLTGATVTDGGADGNIVGNVSVTALEATATADFSNVSLHATATKTANAANTVDFTGDLGGFAVTVAAGKTFEATAARLSGITVTDPGGNATTKVTDVTYAGGATLDLSGIQTNTITFGNGSTDLTLGAGTTLSIREAHLANIAGGGGADTIVDGAATGHVKVYGFTGDVDIAEINVDGNVTGYVSGAQSITADATNIEELTALVIQSGGSLAMTQAQANAFAGKLTKEAGAGNVTATVDGDLSALNLSVVDALTVDNTGTGIVLVDSTADLKAAASIDANSKLITVNSTIDLTGKTITDFGALTVDTNQLTVSAEQIAGFTGGGTVTKSNDGLIKVHVGSTTNISGLNTSDASSITLNTSGSDVTMTTAQNLQVIDGIGTNTITLSNNGTTNGVAGIENYVLSSAGANSFTLASNTAQVTGGTNNDTIVGGTGVSTIIGGAGVDILSGGGAADTFSFSTNHTGITALTADRILDFTTNVDKIKINGTVGDVREADGVGMLFSAFVSAATAGFDGTGIDVYAAFNVSGSGDTYVAIDHNSSGTFNSGDTLIVLNNLNLDNQLVAGDFIA